MKSGYENIGGVWQKGVIFGLAAAIISGFSIYINKFAVMQMKDPFVFTTAKNASVALLLIALFIVPGCLPELRRLRVKQWLSLGVLGAIGGSIPFLLFFYGLSLATAPSAAFIQKTLFLWVAALAFFFLRERPGRLLVGALALLVIGNLVLLGWPGSWAMGRAELFVLAATLLWAIEAVVAKKVMSGISSRVASFGRMFFGAAVMLAYLAVTGKADALASLSGLQLTWIGATAILLLGYVTCYYAGLKHATASVVCSILVLGSVITSLLYAIIDARRYTPADMAGLALIVAAAALLFYSQERIRTTVFSPEVKT